MQAVAKNSAHLKAHHPLISIQSESRIHNFLLIMNYNMLISE